MIRNLKALGLALVAVFAMSAIAASAAQAVESETAEFSWATGTTKVDATQDPTSPNWKIVTTAGTFTCDEVHGHAAVTGTGAKTLTFTELTVDDAKTVGEGVPNTCTGPLGVKATFAMNGCHVIVHAGTTIGTKEKGESEGTAGTLCPGVNKFIEIKVPGCTIKIPEQGGTEGTTLGPITLKTVKTGSKEEVTGTSEIGLKPGNVHNRGFKSTHTGVLCGTGEDLNGTLESRFTLKGTDVNGAQTDLTIT